MENILMLIIGVVFIIIGLLNRKGNVSMLHSYHKKRVSEEDMLPFGKMVGLGMIIIGIAMIFAAILFFLFVSFNAKIYNVLGNVVLGVGFAAGLIVSFYAMLKYNKGIF